MFNLTNDQVNQLKSAWDQHRVKPLGQRNLNEVYSLLFTFLSSGEGENATPLPGVSGSFWYFVKAAAFINKDGNDMATVTRVYSAVQAHLRRGVAWDDALNRQVQEASDQIAISVLGNVIDKGETQSGLPTIAEVERRDAVPASEFLFDGDPGGWVGSPLFIFFGHDRAFKDYITDTIDPTDRGGYDIIALASALSTALQAIGVSPVKGNVFKTLQDLFRTIVGNDEGLLGTTEIIASAINEYDATLKKLYGSAFGLTQIGLSVTESLDFDLNEGGLILGTNRLDTGDDLNDSSLADFIHAGKGDDKIHGGTNSDLIDGGQGRDTLDYALLGAEVEFRFENKENLKDYTITASKGDQGTDKIFNVERIKGSIANDRVLIEKAEPDLWSKIDWIDLGAGVDSIKVTDSTRGYVIDLHDGKNQTVQLKDGSGATLHLRNAENAYGGAGDDVINNADLSGKTSSGKDPLVLDLNGDGVSVAELDANTSPLFDIDGDGIKEIVSWATGGDGFLARDLNNNGRIDDAAELFGFNNGSGFADLRTLDDNNDGVIDAKDVAFSSLRVWIDANGDAKTDAGELKTLADLGISSISLTTRTLHDVRAVHSDSSASAKVCASYVPSEFRSTRFDGIFADIKTRIEAVKNSIKQNSKSKLPQPSRKQKPGYTASGLPEPQVIKNGITKTLDHFNAIARSIKASTVSTELEVWSVKAKYRE